MTDGLGRGLVAHFAIEPAACIQCRATSRQRQTPLAEMLAQEIFVEGSQVADFAERHSLQITFGDFADADVSDVERREEAASSRSTQRTPLGLA